MRVASDEAAAAAGRVSHLHATKRYNFGLGQGAVMTCGWEGNRMSDVGLAIRHRLQLFIQLRAHGLTRGDEHPETNTPHVVWRTLSLLIRENIQIIKGLRRDRSRSGDVHNDDDNDDDILYIALMDGWMVGC